jgi:hypothetical protein
MRSAAGGVHPEQTFTRPEERGFHSKKIPARVSAGRHRTEGLFLEPSRNRLVTSPHLRAFPLRKGLASDAEAGPKV